MTTSRKPRIYTTTCAICDDEMTTRCAPSKRKDGIVCRKPECQAKRNEMITAANAEISARRSAAAKAAHARRDEPVQAWGDWGQLVAFNARKSR
jgi:hypothetical protein